MLCEMEQHVRPIIEAAEMRGEQLVNYIRLGILALYWVALGMTGEQQLPPDDSSGPTCCLRCDPSA